MEIVNIDLLIQYFLFSSSEQKVSRNSDWRSGYFWFTPLMTDLALNKTTQVKMWQVKYCLCTLVVVIWPPVLAKMVDQVLPLPVYVSGTLLWINPSSVGHWPGLGYSLGCTSTPLLSVFALLNDFAPAWSYLITEVPSQRAKKFSLYISEHVCRNLKTEFDKEPASTVLLRVSLRG